MLALYLAQLDSFEDKTLFTAVYEQHEGKMFNIAKAILGSAELANEAVHETFLKIIRNFADFSALEEEHRNGWIALTTKYTALNILKKEKCYIPVKDEYLFSMIDTKRDDTMKCLYEDLADAINELPPMYCEILELYYVQGYTNKEIAVMLNISVENSMQRLSRARKLLLEKMNDEQD